MQPAYVKQGFSGLAMLDVGVFQRVEDDHKRLATLQAEAAQRRAVLKEELQQVKVSAPQQEEATRAGGGVCGGVTNGAVSHSKSQQLESSPPADQSAAGSAEWNSGCCIAVPREANGAYGCSARPGASVRPPNTIRPGGRFTDPAAPGGLAVARPLGCIVHGSAGSRARITCEWHCLQDAQHA